MRRDWLAAVAGGGVGVASLVARSAFCAVYRRLTTQHFDERWSLHAMSMSLDCHYCGANLVVVPKGEGVR